VAMRIRPSTPANERFSVDLAAILVYPWVIERLLGNRRVRSTL
jgi:hypothetical protein